MWYYDIVRSEQAKFLEIIYMILNDPDNDKEITKLESAWQESYKLIHKRSEGPYTACANCNSKCQFHFEVEEILRDSKIMADFDSSFETEESEKPDALANITVIMAKMVLNVFDFTTYGNLPQEIKTTQNKDLSYCIALHYIMKKKMAHDASLKFLNKMPQAIENSINFHDQQDKSRIEEYRNKNT